MNQNPRRAIWLRLIFFLLVLSGFGFVAAAVVKKEPVHHVYTPPEVRETVIKKLRELFEAHKNHEHVPQIKDDDLFCKCTENTCDHEIVDVAGHEYAGFCRVAKGGICQRTNSYNVEGDLREVHMQCLPYEVLHPPLRPFQCHAQPDHPRLVQFCCQNASLCNDVIIPEKLAPMHPERESSGYALRIIGIFFIIAAALFVGYGACAGIFWLSSKQTKRIILGVLGRIPILNMVARQAAARNNAANRTYYRQDQTVLIDVTNTDSTPANDPDENDFTPDPVEASDGAAEAQKGLTRRTIARQIRLHEIISKGRFGDVWRGDWRGEEVAVKIFCSREERSWWRETEIYTTNTLRHANILRWIASDNKDAGSFTQLWLVTEFMPLGSLYDYLGKETLTKKIGMQMMRSMAHGLTYLHAEVPGVQNQCYKPPIAHRDLKSKNILVKNDLTCAIADLGLAVRFLHGRMEDEDLKRVGTIRYMAPEIFTDSEDRKFSHFMQADVYAMGLIFWEILQRVNYQEELGVPSGSHEYTLPYDEYIDRDPELDEMKEIVVVQKKRPTIDPKWRNDDVMNEMARVVEESWADNASSRLPPLNIRNSIDKLVEHSGLKIQI